MKNQFLPKQQQNYFWISALIFFVASWGLPWDLISNIIDKEAYRKPKKASKKPPGSYKKFHGRNPEIISLVFWMKLIFHKDILKLTNLYLSLIFKNVLKLKQHDFIMVLGPFVRTVSFFNVPQKSFYGHPSPYLSRHSHTVKLLAPWCRILHTYLYPKLKWRNN